MGGFRQDAIVRRVEAGGTMHTGDGFQLPMANIGGNVKLGRRLKAHINYGSLNRTGFGNCDPCSNPRINSLLVGLKYMGKKWDADFGFMMNYDPDDDSGDIIPLPLISLTRTY